MGMMAMEPWDVRRGEAFPVRVGLQKMFLFVGALDRGDCIKRLTNGADDISDGKDTVVHDSGGE